MKQRNYLKLTMYPKYYDSNEELVYKLKGQVKRCDIKMFEFAIKNMQRRKAIDTTTPCPMSSRVS